MPCRRPMQTRSGASGKGSCSSCPGVAQSRGGECETCSDGRGLTSSTAHYGAVIQSCAQRILNRIGTDRLISVPGSSAGGGGNGCARVERFVVESCRSGTA